MERAVLGGRIGNAPSGTAGDQPSAVPPNSCPGSRAVSAYAVASEVPLVAFARVLREFRLKRTVRVAARPNRTLNISGKLVVGEHRNAMTVLHGRDP